ncbi:MAG: GntR family transcriptional regulator [Sphaerochaetaceae bacterium]|jgi:DNA-binding GntR family transcriptional regulator|nr:GntR family transcriptional regulator [Sphaerochaetaceae bacterium]MDX9809556.1 GntR family transcriptional regulator [Sphaerochaetaceae bacterium]NLV85201.1 GntR family transcriptional regulator [Spirochaetales bacterium]
MATSYDYDFQSSSDRAYEIIYNMILDGTLKPGEKLIRRKLAKQSGVSTIPVLEALLRLEADGIVESMPYRGSRVIQVTHEKIMDWYALREAVECQVARILATKIREHELHDLYSLAHRLDKMEAAGQTDEEFWDLHYLMHQKMAELTDRRSLIDALTRINFFHLLQRAQMVATEHHNQIPSNNHELIVDALASNDPRIAEDAMREHIHHSGIYEINGKKSKMYDESPVSRKIKVNSDT